MSNHLLIADRYRIENPERDLLGRGGMGDVYRAADTLTGATVAVKALSPDVLVRDPELLERFLREGEALLRLNHPNIVHMVAACEESGRHYLVMEYVGGGSLETLIQEEGRLSPARAVEIGLDLADALTRAHRLGIIHRDLKPANVLLAPDGTPRLADFGIAHVATGPQITQTGILIGTVDYLSPEACQGEPLDERTDIWAFGVLLFEMLSDRLPFSGPNLTAALTAILTQPVPDLAQIVPGLPDGLVDLVYRMLEKDRQQRIPSVRQVGLELEALLKNREPVTPTPTGRAGSRFAAPTPAAEARRYNLPGQTTPFVGRQAELAVLARLLADPAVRLVSIVALGGMGKTRLALEAGAAALERFADGVFFVPLAPLQTTAAIE
jgi:non-specific serine/threonine protein kinase